jgi:hypothetical protein
MAIIITPNGTTQEVEPKNGTDFQRDELQRIVGGGSEIITLDDGRIMVVNESGKLSKLPHNDAATLLAKLPVTKQPRQMSKPSGLGFNVTYEFISREMQDFIAGTALVCNREEVLQ